MKKRYKFSLFVLALLSCTLAYPQQRAIIRGRVIDKVEKIPVIGANVIEYDRDNRIINLRLCTNQENSQNMMRSKANTTGFKGVSRCGARFRAYINQDRRQIHLGVFATSEEAHAAYVRAAESLGWPVYCSG